jgi:hypothetical protein
MRENAQGGPDQMFTSPKTMDIVVPLRWIARIWSVLSALLVILSGFDPGNRLVAEPVPFIEWLLVSLYAVAAAGLLLAWRWELLGAGLAIASMLVEIPGFRLIKGVWYPNVFAFAVPVVLFILPGILFLVCWGLLQRRVPLAR